VWSGESVCRRQVWLVVIAATEEESGGSRGTIQTVAGGEQQETDHVSANTNKNKHYLLACVVLLRFSIFCACRICSDSAVPRVTVLIDVSCFGTLDLQAKLKEPVLNALFKFLQI